MLSKESQELYLLFFKFSEVYFGSELQLDICYCILVISSSSNLSALHKRVMQRTLTKLLL